MCRFSDSRELLSDTTGSGGAGHGGTPERVEIATLEYIDWWNNRRLHTEIGDISPGEKEAMHYAEKELSQVRASVG